MGAQRYRLPGRQRTQTSSPLFYFCPSHVRGRPCSGGFRGGGSREGRGPEGRRGPAVDCGRARGADRNPASGTGGPPTVPSAPSGGLQGGPSPGLGHGGRGSPLHFLATPPLGRAALARPPLLPFPLHPGVVVVGWPRVPLVVVSGLLLPHAAASISLRAPQIGAFALTLTWDGVGSIRLMGAALRRRWGLGPRGSRSGGELERRACGPWVKWARGDTGRR